MRDGIQQGVCQGKPICFGTDFDGSSPQDQFIDILSFIEGPPRRTGLFYFLIIESPLRGSA
jgi:hypothetical protein